MIQFYMDFPTEPFPGSGLPGRPPALRRRAAGWLVPGFLALLGGLLPAAETGAVLAMQLLRTQCISCHNEEKRKGGLSLLTREAMLQGGEEGPVLLEGKPEESSLIRSLGPAADPHMPPKKQLSAARIRVLEEWVKAGAPWDAAALAGQDPPPRPVSLAVLPAAYKPVMALALSPDGTRLAAGCRNEVLIFDNRPGGLVFRGRASAHLDPVQSLAWLPGGRRLVTGSFRRAVVWNTEPLAAQREILHGLTGRITAIRPLPDGRGVLLADGLAGEKGIVRVVDADSGAVTRSWPAHDDAVFAMALTADGRTLATAGGDRLVRFWEVAEGRETGKMEAHATQVLGLAFNADSSRLVTGGADRQLKVWDVGTRENTVAPAPRLTAFNDVTWNPAGPVFTVTDDGVLLRYTDLKTHTGAQSSETGSERQLAKVESPLFTVAVTGDGERIFAGSADGRIFGWDKEGKQTDNIDAAAVAPPDLPK